MRRSVALLGVVGRFCLLLLLVSPAGFALADSKPVTVFAAASLKGPLDKAADAWSSETGTRVVFSFASSAVLAKQISFGAPADLYLSAHPRWMDWLAKGKHLKTGTRAAFLSNSLALVAPRDAKIELQISPDFPLLDALSGGRLALGNPLSVPAGIYAKEALTSLGVWTAIEAQTAFAENVRVALQYVARGEAPLGIVYQSDARAEPRVRIVGLIPPTAHSQIRYEISQTQRSSSAAASAFLTWLTRSETARAIFQDAGFDVLPRTPRSLETAR